MAIEDVVNKIGSLVGRPELVKLGAIENVPGEPLKLYADVNRLRNEVGWQPRFDLPQGLEATIQWWTNHLEDERS